jgi:tRNA-dihydrouridine synthase A
MMGYTNSHQRKLMRLISKSAVLYTEMVVASTLLHTKNLHQHLGADFEDEDPLVLQLGGSDPKQLAEAAEIAKRYGYRRINLNVGCPSERVAGPPHHLPLFLRPHSFILLSLGSGCFGASLMMNPELVADICRAIADRTAIVPSIKCRIGVNNADSYPHLAEFVDMVSKRGEVHQFIIHARKAVLDPSWSPQKNRTIPPLRYEYVYQLLRDFPHLSLGINGGIRSYDEISGHLLRGVAEVMVGRGVIDDPFYYHQIDRHLLPIASPTTTPPFPTRGEVLESYVKYVQQEERKSLTGESGSAVPRSYLLAPILNIFTGCHNGKVFRRLLSESEKENSSVADAILRASQVIPDEVMGRSALRLGCERQEDPESR